MHTCTGNTTLSIPESTVNTSTFSLVWNVMLFCIIMHILLFTHLQGKLLLSTLLIIYGSPYIITYSLIVANTLIVINYFSLSFIQNHWDQGDMVVHILKAFPLIILHGGSQSSNGQSVALSGSGNTSSTVNRGSK